MANKELNRQVNGITPEAKKIIMEYPWYGNLRELRNVMKRAVLMADGEDIDQFCFPEEIIYPQNYSRSENIETTEIKSDSKLKNASYEIEKQLIIKTIREAGFNKSKAARILNIDRKTLYNKLKLYDINL